MLLQVRKRIDSVECRIERCFDGSGWCRGGLPEIDFIRSFEIGAICGAQYLHAWTVGIRGVRLGHHGDLPSSQADEVAGGINSDQLSESAHEVLIELCSVVAFQNRKDPIGWKR